MSILVGKKFSGPRGHVLKGCLHEIQRDPLGLYTQCQREYGDYVRVCIVPGIFCYVLTHPDAVEYVLLKGQKNYRKPDIFYSSVGLLVGDGLFTNEGEEWLNQRRLAQPAFHSHTLSLLSPVMVEGAEVFMRQHAGNQGQPIDMLEGMMKVGLRIASTTLFSADISDEADAIGRAFRTAFVHVSKRLNSAQLIPNWLPTPANRTFKRAKDLLDREVKKLITERRNNPNKPNDLLTMLIKARGETATQGRMEKLLMDEVLTLLAAGHENMGAGLAWTWYLLATHPKIQEDVYDEVYGRLKGRNPTAEDLPFLPLTKAVFEESMRMYPPGWGELRQSIAPDEVNGYPLPSKAIIILCQFVTHRHPDFWEAPDQFRPERFSPQQVAKRHRFAYFPFGGGPRICIGQQFAMIEGMLIIATILQRYRVEMATDEKVELDATFTLCPKKDLKMFLHPRRTGTS